MAQAQAVLEPVDRVERHGRSLAQTSLPARPVEPDTRILELDSLRGLAALAVALYHFTQRYDELYKHADGLWAHLPWGRFGVQLFFIISGFVILMSVSRAKSAGGFALQRAARLYPAFWVACIVTWLIVHFAGLPGRDLPLPSAAINLTMAPFWFKWLEAFTPFKNGIWYIDGAYWSLKEELLFYIVMAFTLLTRLRKHALWVVAGIMTLHLFKLDSAPWFLNWLGFEHPKDLMPFNMRFTLRWFSLFAIGMVIYETRSGFRIRHAVVLALIFATLIPPGFWNRKPDVEGWENFVLITSLAFAVFLTTRYQPRLLRIKPLIFLGTISYSFYLLHQNIGYIVIRESYEHLGVGPNTAVLFALAIITILASALTFGVEKPAYRLAKRLIASRHTSHT